MVGLKYGVDPKLQKIIDINEVVGQKIREGRKESCDVRWKIINLVASQKLWWADENPGQLEHLQFELLRFKLEIDIISFLTGRTKSNVNYSAQAFLYLFSHQSIYACLLTIYLELSL